ncbi:MAG: DUF3592 domain-containing protein [Pseudomonadales bacterium]
MRLKLQIIFFLIFCIPGFSIVGYSTKLAWSTMQLAKSGVFETGVIIKYERPTYSSRRPKLGSRLCPAVQFNYQQNHYIFSDSWCVKSPENYPEGSAVPVVFIPDAPSEARINQFWELYGASLISALIGIPWLLIGIALVIRVR